MVFPCESFGGEEPPPSCVASCAFPSIPVLISVLGLVGTKFGVSLDSDIVDADASTHGYTRTQKIKNERPNVFFPNVQGEFSGEIKWETKWEIRKEQTNDRVVPPPTLGSQGNPPPQPKAKKSRENVLDSLRDPSIGDAVRMTRLPDGATE